MDFFGREKEIGDLMALWGKRCSSLVTCRGRRRIGKSTLIEVFAQRSRARFIRIEGVRPKPEFSDKTEFKLWNANPTSCGMKVQQVAERKSDKLRNEGCISALKMI